MPSILLNNIPFDDSDLEDERNVVLGKFMTVWSQVETLCAFHFRKLAQAQEGLAQIIFDHVGMREQIDILSDLAETLPQEDDRDRMLRLMKDVDGLSVKRNKIVHASWGLFDHEPARFWRSLTAQNLNEIMEQTQKGKSLRTSRIFTTTDLRGLINYGLALRAELEAALQEISVINEKEDFDRQLSERRAKYREQALRGVAPIRMIEEGLPDEVVQILRRNQPHPE
ncbi:MAG: hypothetical protein DCF29_16545 [Alphaproteobacteria bacterium]|nr:MAG: hypothetical protein DCF29_16545 [Alphaproteobacteria bacterium]